MDPRTRQRFIFLCTLLRLLLRYAPSPTLYRSMRATLAHAEDALGVERTFPAQERA